MTSTLNIMYNKNCKGDADKGGNKMKFNLKSSKKDPVKTYVSEDGFVRITKRPSSRWIVKRVSMFDILGETIGEFDSLEEAVESVQ